MLFAQKVDELGRRPSRTAKQGRHFATNLLSRPFSRVHTTRAGMPKAEGWWEQLFQKSDISTMRSGSFAEITPASPAPSKGLGTKRDIRCAGNLVPKCHLWSSTDPLRSLLGQEPNFILRLQRPCSPAIVHQIWNSWLHPVFQVYNHFPVKIMGKTILFCSEQELVKVHDILVSQGSLLKSTSGFPRYLPCCWIANN